MIFLDINKFMIKWNVKAFNYVILIKYRYVSIYYD
jgi:hypothetical protein